jgi:hypothetical protein
MRTFTMCIIIICAGWFGMQYHDKVAAEDVKKGMTYTDAVIAAHNRVADNEKQGAIVMRNIVALLNEYATSHPHEGFPKALSEIDVKKISQNLSMVSTDVNYTTMKDSAYYYTYLWSQETHAKISMNAISGYVLTAMPITPRITANKSFYADDSGIMCVSDNGPATSSSKQFDPLADL